MFIKIVESPTRFRLVVTYILHIFMTSQNEPLTRPQLRSRLRIRYPFLTFQVNDFKNIVNNYSRNGDYLVRLERGKYRISERYYAILCALYRNGLYLIPKEGKT